jgi:hypothetical protein
MAGEPEGRATGLAAGLAVLGAGVAVDALMFHSLPGVGVPLAAAIALAVGVAVARPRRTAFAFLAAAMALAGFAAIRTSPPLVFFDLVGAGALVVAGASFSRAGEPLRASLGRYVSAAWSAFVSIPGGARLAVAPAAGLGRGVRSPRIRTVGRSVAVAVPLLVVFGVLLASADAVFARVVSTPLRVAMPETFLTHVVGTGVAALAVATLVVASGRTVPDRLVVAPTSGLGRAPWVTALAAVDAMLLLFVAIQFAYLFGGRSAVLADTGLTYAEYARSGFWQLLAVSGLTLGVVAAGWTFARRSTGADRMWFTILSCLLIVLTLVVLASAFRRLTLYEQEFGFTRLRILVHATILLLAAVLVATLVGVLTGRVRWVTTVALGLATLTLVGLNVVNLDRTVAEHNLARFHQTGKVDVDYLGSLSPDASPTLVAALPDLPRDVRHDLADHLDCIRLELQAHEPWTAANLGRDRARAALEDLPPSARCP